MIKQLVERCPGYLVKSLQKGEPDLTRTEKEEELTKVLKTQPAAFLRRFGSFLEEQHLEEFEDNTDDYEVAYCIKELKEGFDLKKQKTKIKNRRFCAMKTFDSENFFSEQRMRRRNPLLYSELVESNLTAEEISEKRSREAAVEMTEECGGASPNDAGRQRIGAGPATFSRYLLRCYDESETNKFEKYQKHLEGEEDEEEEDEDEEEEEDNDEKEDDDKEEEEESRKAQIPTEEKELMESEFRSSMREQFLDGGDGVFGVDYGAIDDDEDFDDLEMIGRDAQDKWFEEDDDDDDDKNQTSTEHHVEKMEENGEEKDVDYLDFVIEEK